MRLIILKIRKQNCKQKTKRNPQGIGSRDPQIRESIQCFRKHYILSPQIRVMSYQLGGRGCKVMSNWPRFVPRVKLYVVSTTLQQCSLQQQIRWQQLVSTNEQRPKYRLGFGLFFGFFGLLGQVVLFSSTLQVRRVSFERQLSQRSSPSSLLFFFVCECVLKLKKRIILKFQYNKIALKNGTCKTTKIIHSSRQTTANQRSATKSIR